MKEFIENITKQLVDAPSKVHVEEIVGEHTVIYELRVGDGDMGKVIGKNGRMADSLRLLLAVATAKQDKRSVLEIVETDHKQKS